MVYAQGTRIAGSGAFSTDLGGVGGPLRLLVGHGFWQRGFQVGGATGVVVPAARAWRSWVSPSSVTDGSTAICVAWDGGRVRAPGPFAAA